MFGISMWELGLILLVALILLGPRQLTETAKVLGRLYREVQKMTSDLRNSVDLNSLTNPTYPEKDDRQKTEEASARYKDQEIAPVPGDKSGPDFYAELLESSQTEAEIKDSSAALPEASVPAENRPEEGPNVSAEEESHKKERA